MAEHIWTVLCEKHVLDPDSKVVSLIEVVENITEEGLDQRIKEALSLGKKGALINTPMQLVSWWWRSNSNEETLQARVLLLNPKGENIFTQEVSAEWGEGTETPATLRVFFRLDGLPVSMLGLHWFVVEQRDLSNSEAPHWVTVAKLPLGVESA